MDGSGRVRARAVALCRVRSLSAGQTRRGSRTLALEHEAVGLADVAVPGDGGRLVEIHLLRLRLLISSHGEIVVV